MLERLGVDAEKIAAARFTFVFKPQEHDYTRQELGIWEHGFVLMIVGWRLDSEIADDFLAMLDRIAAQRENVQVVFMGRYESWKTYRRDMRDCGSIRGISENRRMRLPFSRAEISM